MSIKLYDGLRLVDPDADLTKVVPQVAQAIRPVFHQLRLQIVAQQFASVVDAGRPEDPKDNDIAFFTAQKKWLKRQAAYGSRHTLNDPLRFSIVFGRAASGDLLAYPYLAREAYKDALMATGLFAEYGYWNNTDRPEGVTDKEWNAVRDNWHSLENPEGTFETPASHHGLRGSLFSSQRHLIVTGLRLVQLAAILTLTLQHRVVQIVIPGPDFIANLARLLPAHLRQGIGPAVGLLPQRGSGFLPGLPLIKNEEHLGVDLLAVDVQELTPHTLGHISLSEHPTGLQSSHGALIKRSHILDQLLPLLVPHPHIPQQ